MSGNDVSLRSRLCPFVVKTMLKMESPCYCMYIAGFGSNPFESAYVRERRKELEMFVM